MQQVATYSDLLKIRAALRHDCTAHVDTRNNALFVDMEAAENDSIELAEIYYRNKD